MSNLRKAAEQALDVLIEMSNEWGFISKPTISDRMEAITALLAALKETEQDWSMLEAAKESLREHMLEIQRLRAELEQKERTVTIPEGMTKSDAEFWINNRAAIIEACEQQGFSIYTTINGTRLIPLKKVEDNTG